MVFAHVIIVRLLILLRLGMQFGLSLILRLLLECPMLAGVRMMMLLLLRK